MANIESFLEGWRSCTFLGVINLDINGQCQNRECVGDWAEGEQIPEGTPWCIGLKGYVLATDVLTAFVLDVMAEAEDRIWK